MLAERFQPGPIKRVLGLGALALAMGACGGGQPVPGSHPDSGSSVPIFIQAAILEPTLNPTAGSTLEPTLTQAPEPTLLIPNTETIYTNKPYGFWMPDIHINQTQVGVIDCGSSGSALPNSKDIFSSACAGKNNLLLLGHAYDVFKPLRNAYISGSLKVGEIAYYTDGIGVLYAYDVTSIEHLTVSEFNMVWWADSPTPVMTLVTCDDGVNPGDDAYRIVVRLVPTEVPSDWQQRIAVK